MMEKDVVRDHGQEVRKMAVGYARVSTKEQGARGASLEAQRDAIDRFADFSGYTVLDHFSDVASGAGEDSFHQRSGLQDALRLAASEGADVIVWSWDRLSRYADIENQIRTILPAACEVICVEDPMTLRRASEAARFEHAERRRKVLSETTSEALAKKKAQGAQLGNPTIRELQGKASKANADKAQLQVERIASVLRQEDAAGLSYAEIAALLNGKGIRTSRNKEWNASRVRIPVTKARKLLQEEEAFYSKQPGFGMM